MRGKISTLLMALGVAMFLVVASVPQMTQKAAAQDGTIDEVEPNDSKEDAQVIALTPGTHVIDGAAARGDGASFVEELEILFQLGDPMEDWYAFDVGGAVAKQDGGPGVVDFSADLAWPEASDVDSWILADMNDFVFFDGLVSHQLAASLSNPEQYPGRIYYTYSDRTDEVDEDVQPVPDTSRFYILVSNFDDGTSPPTDYTLTLNVGGPCEVAKQDGGRTVIHDTSGPGFFATVEPSDLMADNLTALERITPPAYPASVDAVSVFNFSGATADVMANLIVLTDADGTGDPTNATEVLRTEVTLAAVENTTTFRFDLTGAGISVDSGDIYVGFELPGETNGVHIPFDIDKAGFRRTVISTDRGQTYGRLLLASNDVGINFRSNSAINAELTLCGGTVAKRSGRVKMEMLPKRGAQRYQRNVTLSMK